MENELDITKLKYVLYARKSRTDETAQVRSIPDQIAECKILASRIGIKVVKIFKEAQSAKRPNQRPVFDELMKGIKSGVYEGILAWNPDRLARNMLEGGMIIDLIDQDIIKDLKFATHTFTKDANGLMLLGMSFVLSKQYSDDLSQKVTRGVRRRFEEGKTPTPKHGYLNDGGNFRPDGKNFEIMREAWDMRLEGKSLEFITKNMNEQGYGRAIKKDGRMVKMTTKILTGVFHDPFYYGLLVQAGQTVDLRELDPEFEPMVTHEEHNQVQLLSKRRLTPYNTRRYTFYPLKAIVRCALCERNMVVAPSTSHTKTKRYLYYRCDNPNCKRKKRSIRAKVVFEFIYQFLRDKFKLTEADYRKYYDRLDKLSGERRIVLKTKIHSLQGRQKALEADIQARSLKIVDMNLKDKILEVNKRKIEEEGAEKEDLDKEIEELKAKLTDPEKDRLTLEQFLNLIKNADTIVKSADAVKKDVITRLIFLNLDVDEEKVASYRLKEPFATLLKSRNLPPSRVGIAKFEPPGNE
ncbi:recombinase family protein [Patescibacteria group bacterium]